MGLLHHWTQRLWSPSQLWRIFTLWQLSYLTSPVVLSFPKCQEERLCASNSGLRCYKNICGKENKGLKTGNKFQWEKPSPISLSFPTTKRKYKVICQQNHHVGYLNCYTLCIILNNNVRESLYMCLFSWDKFLIAEPGDITWGAQWPTQSFAHLDSSENNTAPGQRGQTSNSNNCGHGTNGLIHPAGPLPPRECEGTAGPLWLGALDHWGQRKKELKTRMNYWMLNWYWKNKKCEHILSQSGEMDRSIHIISESQIYSQHRAENP